MTIKTLRGWGLVVHALPQGNASGESGIDGRGPAELAGIQCGDIIVGLDGRLLRPWATADDVASAVRSSPFPDAILTLDRSLNQYALANARRGEYVPREEFHQVSLDHQHPPAAAARAALRVPPPPPLNRMAEILVEQKVIASTQAQILTNTIAQVNRRSTQWENRNVVSEELPPDRQRRRIDESDYLDLYHFGSPGNAVLKNESGERANQSDNQAISSSDLEKTVDGSGGSYSEKMLPRDSIDSVPLTNAIFIRMSIPRQLIPTATAVPIAAASKRWRRGWRAKGSVVRHSMKGVRPALSIRILSVDQQSKDHTEYGIWILDVSTGVEWVIQRRYKEFHQLRERLNALRPALSSLEFPVRTTGLYETEGTIRERKMKLER